MIGILFGVECKTKQRGCITDGEDKLCGSKEYDNKVQESTNKFYSRIQHVKCTITKTYDN